METGFTAGNKSAAFKIHQFIRARIKNYVPRNGWPTLCLAAALSASLPGYAHDEHDWTLTDLGTLGGYFSIATSINERGQIAGYSEKAGSADFHAFIYQHGRMQEIGKTAGFANRASAINDAGQVAGYNFSEVPDRAARPFLFSRGTFSLITSAVGRAWGINNFASIVGEANIGPNQENHAFVYRHGNMKDLGTLGGLYSSASAINNMGIIVGSSAMPDIDSRHAFYYDHRGMTDMGTLGGIYSGAHGINDRGQIVGSSTTDNTSFTTHAFLYSGRRMHDLGTLGGPISQALGINNKEQIVGTSGTATEPEHAFLYAKGKMLDLNDIAAVKKAGWILRIANAINNSGQIVGYGEIIANGNGYARAFLLTPPKAHQGGHHLSNPFGLNEKGRR
jgi:probable HAF family extracellular repeat protein